MPQRQQETLFVELPEPAAALPSDGGLFAGVAMEQAIDRILDYSVPRGMAPSLRVGQRVKAPLGRGNRGAFGYVVRITSQSAFPKTKPLSAIDDRRVLLDDSLMKLALWMSRYYVCPLGGVIESIIPSAVKKKVGLGYKSMVRLIVSREEAQAILEKTKTPKRRAVIARLLQLPADESIELIRLAGEADVKAPTIRKLRSVGLIAIDEVPDLPNFGAYQGQREATETHRPMNAEQQAVFDDLKPRMAGGFSVNLLRGVTGSGKTEVYLHAIQEVVNLNRQAIVLVPEIALTPQTVRRFTARFPRVAVLHSGLSASTRHKYWQQISRGEASVVVGARSAVFAPTPHLGLIVVDEEHESSYKQDAAPRYHARDVAVKRAQLHDVPVLLGSATPSLEMYQRVCSARQASTPPQGGPDTEPQADSDQPAATVGYHLLEMPHRVRGLQLPHVEVVDLKHEMKLRSGMHLLTQRLEHLLRATLQAKRQAILLLNRRGYANFVHCPSCKHVMTCKYCDATVTYHRMADAGMTSGKFAKGLHTGQLHCHYCLAVNPLPEACTECGKGMSLFGLGTQRVEEELKRKFPDLTFARVDSDTMRSSADYEAILSKFAKGELDVLLGTQMIAKGLDFPNVTLVGVINGDTALSLPDFRAAERTFQLITQVAGRAGRGDSPGRVVLQTFLPNEPAIRFAIKQDFVGFATQELVHRRQIGLPPFARMVRIVLRDQDVDKLATKSDLFAAALSTAAAEHGAAVSVRGPMPCPISRIAGFHRHQIVLTSASPARLQAVLATLRRGGRFATSDRIAVDVDPTSLL